MRLWRSCSRNWLMSAGILAGSAPAKLALQFCDDLGEGALPSQRSESCGLQGLYLSA
jgi:hypothetical protein